MELMVVVVLVSILAVLAIPALRRARDDKAAFDYARQAQLLIARARARAAGTGGAHLVVTDGKTGVRGRVLLFEARDGTAPPGGPNYTSSCKRAGQWDQVDAFAPGVVGNIARIVDGFDLNGTGIVVDADIRALPYVDNAAYGAAVLCVTPGGQTFAGRGADLAGAIGDMIASTAFTGVYEVRVMRHVGGAQIGLTRRVIAAGMAAPRIRSE